MARYECRACHSRYTNPQENGQTYYHVCPPLRVLDAMSPRGNRTITDGEQEPDEIVRKERFIEREGHRNENMITVAGATGETLVSAGAGVLIAADDEQLDQLAATPDLPAGDVDARDVLDARRAPAKRTRR